MQINTQICDGGVFNIWHSQGSKLHPFYPGDAFIAGPTAPDWVSPMQMNTIFLLERMWQSTIPKTAYVGICRMTNIVVYMVIGSRSG